MTKINVKAIGIDDRTAITDIHYTQRTRKGQCRAIRLERAAIKIERRCGDGADRENAICC